PGCQPVADGEQPVVGAGFFEYFKCRKPRRARNWIGSQSAAHEAVLALPLLSRVGGLHELCLADQGGKRIAAGHCLAVACQIGDYAIALLRSAPRDSEPRDDFVEDQDDAVFLRDRAQALQKPRLRFQSSLKRLDDNSRELTMMLFDDLRRR